MRHLGWVAAAIGLGCTVASVALSRSHEEGLIGFAGIWLVGGFSLVGAVIVRHRPTHAIGWVFGLYGLLLGMNILFETWWLLGTTGSAWAGWFATWSWAPGLFALVTALPLLFPTGRPPSPRWRWVLWLAGGAVLAIVAANAFEPVPAGELGFPNPVGLPAAAPVLDVVQTVGLFGVAVAAAGAIASAVARFRRARGQERQQLKWFVTGVATAAASVLALLSLSEAGRLDAGRLIFSVGGLALPVSVGIAIVRHRLFDIDLLIRRTLLYAALSAALAGIYLATVATLQAPVRAIAGGDAQVAVVASTLLVAALFAPLRRRLQGWIDRAFYRSHVDARSALEDLATRLRAEVELGALQADVLATVNATVQPAHVTVWIRKGEGSSHRPHASRWREERDR